MQKVRKGQVFVLLASGFEEVDVSTVIRTLRGFGFPVPAVGLTAGPLRGAYGLFFMPDATLSEVETEQPHAVVLPGGVQSARRLNADPRVHALLRRVIVRGGCVLALDTAYVVLRNARVLDESGEEVAEGSLLEVGSGIRASERVVVEGQVIFGRDSGAAQESTLTLVTLLESGA